MSQTMSEYIIRETGYPGTLETEIVGELVRCKDCKHYNAYQGKGMFCTKTVGAEYPREPEEYCSDGERKL